MQFPNSTFNLLETYLCSHGFSRVTAPNGARALARPIHLRGCVLLAVIMDEAREVAPRTFTEPIWVGYYDARTMNEMHDEERFADSSAFFRKHAGRLADPDAEVCWALPE
jgi:hypothetical protein